LPKESRNNKEKREEFYPQISRDLRRLLEKKKFWFSNPFFIPAYLRIKILGSISFFFWQSLYNPYPGLRAKALHPGLSHVAPVAL
jgi:hypothetical protein